MNESQRARWNEAVDLAFAKHLPKQHNWKVGDYAKPKKSIYDTKYRIVEINEHYMVAEIVAAPTRTRIHLNPDNVKPA